MGGASLPTVKTFRGITVDPATFDALTELARIVGDDIRLTPIPGCGSYQTSTAASAGTHAGGGAADLNAEGLTDEQARRVETRARQVGFVAYFRPRISPYSGRSYGWQRHVHVIRRDCTDLAPAAKAQIVSYDKGLDALAVPRKDTGSRAYVGATWAKYVAAQNAAKPATPAPAAPAPLEDDMFSDADRATLRSIEQALAGFRSEEKNRYSSNFGKLNAVLAAATIDDADVSALAAKVGAALPAQGGVSQEALTAAIKAAFASLGDTPPAA